jgi:hypothetical protein
MPSISTHQMITSPINRVWGILTDFARYADWNSYLVRVEGEAKPGVELTVHSVPKIGMEPMTAPVLLVSIQPHAMLWEGGLPDRSRFKGEHWFRLTKNAPNETLLVHEEFFSGTDADAILDQYGATIQAAFERFNADLNVAACKRLSG